MVSKGRLRWRYGSKTKGSLCCRGIGDSDLPDLVKLEADAMTPKMMSSRAVAHIAQSTMLPLSGVSNSLTFSPTAGANSR